MRDIVEFSAWNGKGWISKMNTLYHVLGAKQFICVDQLFLSAQEMELVVRHGGTGPVFY